jgi:hypothetical protein
MPDFILLSGDTANFLPSFGPAMVTVMPGMIMGTGARSKATGKIFCVAGDEKSVMVLGCPYISGAYSAPGTGILKILALAPNQVALRTKSAGKPVLLKGQMFDAIFEVMAPALNPAIGAPDPMIQYPGGKGMFVSTNVRVKGT